MLFRSFGEKYDKDRLIRLIKLGEIAIMVVAAIGFALIIWR